jgi:hypothetical protein
MSNGAHTLADAMKKKLGSITSQPKRTDLFTSTAPQDAVVESTQLETKDATPITPQKVKKLEKTSANITKKVLIPIDLHDLDAINSIVRKVDRNKAKKQHRITANTVIRGLLNLVHDLNIDVAKIACEDDLKQAILDGVKEHSNG